MNFVLRKISAFVILSIGLAFITFVWAFETTEAYLDLAETVEVLCLCILALISALFLGISFNQLIGNSNWNNPKRKSKFTLRIFIVIETIIFFAMSYLINTTTLILMPIFFLFLLSYPALKRAFIINNYIFGLCFSIIPIYIWSSIWGKFNSISGEFTYLPLILGVIIMLWASMLKIRHSELYQTSDEAYNNDILSRKIGNLMINFNISVILGLLFFSTIISGHTPVLWVGLFITVVTLLFISDSLRKTDSIKDLKYFDKLSNLAIIAYTINLIFDVLIDVYFLPN